MKKDYQTKKGRLTKKEDFKLIQGDDSWGFEESPLNLKPKVSKLEKLLYIIVALWYILYVFQAVSFIIKNIKFQEELVQEPTV